MKTFLKAIGDVVTAAVVVVAVFAIINAVDADVDVSSTVAFAAFFAEFIAAAAVIVERTFAKVLPIGFAKMIDLINTI